MSSAVVLAPAAADGPPHRVVAWTHGTTGVAQGCAPSLSAYPFGGVPGLETVLAEGWVVVATDYPGLGTKGPHPYLIGLGEGRATLDSIRAARSIPGLRLADGAVVWGHSQGGGAALWTGLAAPAYAPDVRVAGVAAAAPATDLPALVDRIQHTPIGRILSSYVIHAYAAAYPDVQTAAYLRPWVRPLAYDIAGRCIGGPQARLSFLEAIAARETIFSSPPTEGALGQRLAQNTPQGRLGAPVLIAQGLADDLVSPDMQDRFVATWRASGQPIDYRTYPGRDHISLMAPDSPFTADLIAWTRARFAEAPR